MAYVNHVPSYTTPDPSSGPSSGKAALMVIGVFLSASVLGSCAQVPDAANPAATGAATSTAELYTEHTQPFINWKDRRKEAKETVSEAATKARVAAVEPTEEVRARLKWNEEAFRMDDPEPAYLSANQWDQLVSASKSLGKEKQLLLLRNAVDDYNARSATEEPKAIFAELLKATKRAAAIDKGAAP